MESTVKTANQKCYGKLYWTEESMVATDHAHTLEKETTILKLEVR
jgi:hypothetical protein